MARRSAKHSKPNVSIVQCKHTGYWLVTIACKDRNKLLFDTVRLTAFTLLRTLRIPEPPLITGLHAFTVPIHYYLHKFPKQKWTTTFGTLFTMANIS